MDASIPKTLVSLGILLTVVAVWVYDSWCSHVGLDKVSVSMLVRDAAKQNPFVAFAFGTLIGHLFWGQ